MIELNMHKDYLEVLQNPCETSLARINNIEYRFNQRIDDVEKGRQIQITYECGTARGKNKAQADEARIIVTAYLDNDSPMHDFAVEYVEAARKVPESKIG